MNNQSIVLHKRPADVQLVAPPLPTRVTNNAATKIQAWFRGCKTREKIVMPRDVLPVLREHLITDLLVDNSIHTTALMLCRRIVSIVFERTFGSRCNMFIRADTDKSVMPSVDRQNRKVVTVARDMWVTESTDRHKIQFLIKSSIYEDGSFKRVFRGQCFTVHWKDLKRNPSKFHVEYKPLVLFTHNPYSKEYGSDTLRQDIEKTNFVIENVLKTEHHKITPVPKQPADTDTYFSQPWFNCNLFSTRGRGVVPLDMEGKKTREFTVDDLVQVLIDVAKQVDILHHWHHSHRDLKATNMMVNIDQTGKLSGVLIDLDYRLWFGAFFKTEPYRYWDKVAVEEGIVLPLLDCYGLAVTFAEMVVPSFGRLCLCEEAKRVKEFDPEKVIFESTQILVNTFFNGEVPLGIQHCKTIKEILNAIAQLSAEQTALLKIKQLKKRIEAIEVAVLLLHRIKGESEAVYRLLINSPKSLAILRTYGTNADQNYLRMVIDEAYEVCMNTTTIGDIKMELQALKARWQ